jgi:hypothetical protein
MMMVMMMMMMVAGRIGKPWKQKCLDGVVVKR